MVARFLLLEFIQIARYRVSAHHLLIKKDGRPIVKKLLICTDLDRTLIPNGTAEESSQARALFGKLVARPEVVLAYVSGRDLESIDGAISEFELPQPDFAIADVGSSIYSKQAGEWSRLEEWDSQSAGYCKRDRWGEIGGLFDDLDYLELQEPAKQGLYKLSYYVSAGVDRTALMVKMKNRLKWEEVQAKVIWSTDEHQKLGLLDILPANADKREAVEFLMRRQRFRADRTVFAGDSGNDMAVLASPIPAILVANAGDEVKRQAYRRSRENRTLESLYIARGGCLGMNGNYGAGILEGVLHFFPQVKEWVAE